MKIIYAFFGLLALTSIQLSATPAGSDSTKFSEQKIRKWTYATGSIRYRHRDMLDGMGSASQLMLSMSLNRYYKVYGPLWLGVEAHGGLINIYGNLFFGPSMQLAWPVSPSNKVILRGGVIHSLMEEGIAQHDFAGTTARLANSFGYSYGAVGVHHYLDNRKSLYGLIQYSMLDRTISETLQNKYYYHTRGIHLVVGFSWH